MSKRDGEHDEEMTAIEPRRTVDADWAESSSTEEAAANPVKLVLDRLHGRWLLAIILGVVLAPVLSYVGYSFAPRTFDSTAVLVVEAKLDPLVEDTPETREIEVEKAVSEQAQLVQNPEVLYTAFDDPRMIAWAVRRPDYRRLMSSNLSVIAPRRSGYFLVSMSDEDPGFAADAVNSIVDAYMLTFGPNNEMEYEDKVKRVQTRIDSTRRRIAQFKGDLNALMLTEQFVNVDIDAFIRDRADELDRMDANMADLSDRVETIRGWQLEEARLRASDAGEPFDPSAFELADDARIEPGLDQLASIDSELPALFAQLGQLENGVETLKSRFGPEHQELRRAQMRLELEADSYARRYESAERQWNRGQGRRFTYGELSRRLTELQSERAAVIDDINQARRVDITVEELEAKIDSENAELRLLENRRQDLDRERESIRRGRVYVRAEGKRAFAPATDKKMLGAVGGAAGGFGIGFLLVILVGSIDQKTFGVRQLEDGRNTLRVLGVMPNMDEVDADGDSVTLATDCVHRIRGRIESRRAPERGYAMMVSSPFQGDGKTTLTVSLGWSYAESGYRTLLVDADFIGRSMTHQFGHLKDPGLREIIRNGSVQDEIHELGHPNLCLLGVGFDRRVSAANLSPRLMGRVLEAVRDQYDVILVDSGPMTASIEALPIASAVDGVVLALRRARSRARLAECIGDVKAVGADYLGVVLNYADRADCLRHGSTSRMSAAVLKALEDTDTPALTGGRNPLLGREDGEDV